MNLSWDSRSTSSLYGSTAGFHGSHVVAKTPNLECATNDLRVLGSPGMTSLERALIGSESQKVLLYSERPVLLIREP